MRREITIAVVLTLCAVGFTLKTIITGSRTAQVTAGATRP
jgi:hypothetical protein